MRFTINANYFVCEIECINCGRVSNQAIEFINGYDNNRAYTKCPFCGDVDAMIINNKMEEKK